MRMFIETVVHSTGVTTEPKDLEKGLGFVLVLQVQKKSVMLWCQTTSNVNQR